MVEFDVGERNEKVKGKKQTRKKLFYQALMIEGKTAPEKLRVPPKIFFCIKISPRNG